MSNDIIWYLKTFNELTLNELYEIIRIRVEVFVVEQNCPYQDLDDLDYNSWHLFGVDNKKQNNNIVTYIRVVKPNLRFKEPSIGRVITIKSHRRLGLSRKLMQRGIEFIEKTYENQGIRISAQRYLEQFYLSLGFLTVSDTYLEDGIEHVEMLKKDREIMSDSLQIIYNKFAKTYEKNRGTFDMTEIISDFYNNLAFKKGELLDLGCGAGEPFPKFFIDNAWNVTGVDFSENMLEMAKKYVPKMKRVYSDITKVDFENNKFNAVTMIYSFFHLKTEDQFKLLSKIYKWLTLNGSILFTYATKEYTGFNEFEDYKEFLGEKLFYAHKTPESLKNKLENIGFKNIRFNYRDIGGETFLWVTANK